ncbi:serine palmitoyltransferase 2 [Cylindrobasidium torrendii FP15055 ss-10]|uniref:serine C-palmitoyltransferase n=1 Tax=Cylindrobasidium torrendii FP15055 ss-10 TaxID=1314674 RepID=A0A0D7B9M9_9AGAR|nr:serine palmitoyltransferase 2 [Cylindrobasidium torrendii FP15055 ss-10]
MPTGSSLPSPMALSRSSPSSSMFKKQQSTPQMSSAASYLSALSQADARARGSRSPTPTATPALSFSSSVTTSTEDTVLNEQEIDNDDGLALPMRAPTSEQVFSTIHTEYGHCSEEAYRYTSQHPQGTVLPEHVEQDPPYYILLSTYISYLLLIILGHCRDFFGKRLHPQYYKHLMPHDGYAPLNSDFDSFYTRRLKLRIDDCFSQPITGVAGRTIQLIDRYSTDFNYTQKFTGGHTRALNISSYNYLGFAQARGGCADVVEESLKRYGVTTCGSRLEGGSSDIHQVAEALVADFVGQEDALISSMGFATNSTVIPALVNRGCLVISDELNHASIRFGVRLSGASVRMFKHNDMNSLESLLREVISQGQPKTHRPWKKILLIVEGLYSMEGTLVNLPVIMQLKKKYKFNLFVDEAHSVGALGPNGRGVANYFGIDPRSIDILMGTFTKSFGAAGGYISGSKTLIDRLRVRGYSGAYAEAMTPPVLTQIIASMASIMGVKPPSTPRAIEDDTYRYPGPMPSSSLPQWVSLPPALTSGLEGRDRLRRLAFNSRYLHTGLVKLGFITYGHPASPIVPLLLFNPGKMNIFHRMMKDRKTPIIVVVVAYPATPLVTSRVRFCVSASHTKEDIDIVLKACDEIGDVLDLKNGIPRSERWPLEEVCARAVELANIDPSVEH